MDNYAFLGYPSFPHCNTCRQLKRVAIVHIVIFYVIGFPTAVSPPDSPPNHDLKGKSITGMMSSASRNKVQIKESLLTDDVFTIHLAPAYPNSDFSCSKGEKAYPNKSRHVFFDITIPSSYESSIIPSQACLHSCSQQRKPLVREMGRSTKGRRCSCGTATPRR